MHKQASECEEVSSLPVIGPPHAEVISYDIKTTSNVEISRTENTKR